MSHRIKTQRDKTGQWDTPNRNDAWDHAAFPISTQ
jgi:hypothetical protein